MGTGLGTGRAVGTVVQSQEPVGSWASLGTGSHTADLRFATYCLRTK